MSKKGGPNAFYRPWLPIRPLGSFDQVNIDPIKPLKKKKKKPLPPPLLELKGVFGKIFQ